MCEGSRSVPQPSRHFGQHFLILSFNLQLRGHLRRRNRRWPNWSASTAFGLRVRRSVLATQSSRSMRPPRPICQMTPCACCRICPSCVSSPLRGHHSPILQSPCSPVFGDWKRSPSPARISPTPDSSDWPHADNCKHSTSPARASLRLALPRFAKPLRNLSFVPNPRNWPPPVIWWRSDPLTNLMHRSWSVSLVDRKIAEGPDAIAY